MRTRSANGILMPISYEESTDIESDNPALQRTRPVTDCNGDYNHVKISPPKKARYSNGIPPMKDPDAPTVMRPAHRGRNVGKLIKLLQMPMDIFCEVCSHLEPVDLLHIARASKRLHIMLMSRESKPLWRAARSTIIGLPDCPSDISEAEYARLLFEKDCHGCLAPRTLKVDLVLRSRLCRQCRKSLLASGEDLLETVPGFTEDLLDCAPSAFVFDELYHHIGHNRKYGTFRKDQVDTLLRKLREAVSPNFPEEATQLAKRIFMAKETASVKAIVKHTQEISLWIYSTYKAKSAAEIEMSTKRKSEIYAKLTELGYNEEDFPNTKAWRKLIEQPKELTPRTWRTLLPKLQDILRKFKIQREESARKTRESRRRIEFAEHVSQLLQDREDTSLQLFMNLQDAFLLPTAKLLITDEVAEHGIPPEKWEANRAQIISEMNDYAERIRIGLKELISNSQPHSPSPADGSITSSDPPTASGIDDAFLTSPFTQFECIVCDKSVQYPGMLKHAHDWAAPWHVKEFRYSATKSLIAQSLLSYMGQFTAKGVVVRGRIFQCLRCEDKISHPMEWSELIQHFELPQAQNNFNSEHSHSLGGQSLLDRPLVVPLTLDQVSKQRTKVHTLLVSEGKKRKECEICAVWGKWIPQTEASLPSSPDLGNL